MYDIFCWQHYDIKRSKKDPGCEEHLSNLVGAELRHRAGKESRHELLVLRDVSLALHVHVLWMEPRVRKSEHNVVETLSLCSDRVFH